jgi:hypothetical protein
MVPTQVDTMTMRRMSKRRARTQLHRRWKQDRRHALLVRYCGGRKGGHNTPTQHQQAGMHQVTGAFPEEAAAAIQATMPQTQTDSGLGLRTPDSGLRTPGGRATGHGPAGRIASRTSGPETKASACTISEYAHAHWPPPGWPLSAVVIVIGTPDASRHYVTYIGSPNGPIQGQTPLGMSNTNAMKQLRGPKHENWPACDPRAAPPKEYGGIISYQVNALRLLRQSRK